MPKETKAGERDKGKELSGIAFVGFFFLGFAVAVASGNWVLAPFLALALGFIAMLFAKVQF